jgi:hypothetical protein
MIIANTVILGITNDKDDRNFGKILEEINLFFFGFFVFELTAKLIGEGFKFYLREKFTWFDSTVVLVSAVDIILVNSLRYKSDGKIRINIHLIINRKFNNRRSNHSSESPKTN